MYAIFWTENGHTGHGAYVLDEQTMRAWLSRLRFRYPEMLHWGQLENGERYAETVPIPLVDDERMSISWRIPERK
jgi:hypothetical protein